MAAKIHKTGKGKVFVDQGFFHKRMVPAPLCDGASGLWAGRTYLLHRNWKAVTCKKCLKKKKV